MIGSLAGELEIVVSLLCDVSLRLRDSGEADALVVLDELGDELELEPEEAPGDTQEGGPLVLRGGRSGPFRVSEEADRIVLYRAGHPVREVPVCLDPGRPNLLEV